MRKLRLERWGHLPKVIELARNGAVLWLCRTDDPGRTALLPPTDLGKDSGLIITAVIDLCQQKTSVSHPVLIPVTPTAQLCQQLGAHLKRMVHSAGWWQLSLIMIISLLETPGPVGFLLVIFQIRLCWECRRNKLACSLMSKSCEQQDNR